uniref:Related to carboxylic acid transport protein JEN1 n=1 Tax=Neurospora crassa TaxID=5141 RepID=Q9P732_NEUCS|nr:related to carboxylic acid transport protein JEN1 [Neurospora crassa]
MESTHEPADPVAKGILPTARQSWKDLFIWKQRVVVTNVYGETATEWAKPVPLKNPISLLAQLSGRDWICFLVGFCAWSADAFDFHALSIQQVKLAAYYGVSKTSVSTAITLTLLLRSIGAAAFGLAGDRWGRKWPMVVNMIVLGILQIATIYSSTYSQFLGVRALFGLFMGGVYGNAIAMALENSPVDARGLMSGILQQGYAFGYVCAACANLGVGGDTDSWKTVFWIAAGLSIGVGIIRCFFPESKQFLEARKEGKAHANPSQFWRETKVMLRQEWKMCVYCCILMTWFNCNHTSQDNYTTFVLRAKEMDNSAASRASIIMKAGACVGGTIIGYLSQYFGRRRTIIVSSLISGCMIPAWILPNSERALSATGFFMQFFVQGAWGVIPIHLNELAPPAFRSSFPGITYQVGNMVSSPSAQIVNAVSEKIHIVSHTGKLVEAYGPTMGIATAIIVMGIVVTTAFGPEKRGREFEKALPAGMNLQKQHGKQVDDLEMETGHMEKVTSELDDEKREGRAVQ